jgi:Protein of unknown function (DUF2829)
MTFGKAIEILKQGGIVRRRGWVPGGMWLCYVEGRTRRIEDKPPTPYAVGLELHGYPEKYVEINAHIDAFVADGSMQPGWTPTQMDMLAGDWEIIDNDNVRQES